MRYPLPAFALAWRTTRSLSMVATVSLSPTTYPQAFKTIFVSLNSAGRDQSYWKRLNSVIGNRVQNNGTDLLWEWKRCSLWKAEHI